MALLGKIESFNQKEDDICEYIERVDQCFLLKIQLMQRKTWQHS